MKNVFAKEDPNLNFQFKTISDCHHEEREKPYSIKFQEEMKEESNPIQSLKTLHVGRKNP